MPPESLDPLTDWADSAVRSQCAVDEGVGPFAFTPPVLAQVSLTLHTSAFCQSGRSDVTGIHLSSDTVQTIVVET